MNNQVKRRPYVVRAKAKDVARYSRDLSLNGARAAAVVIEGMRRLQAETGPGHFPLDLLTSILPEAYRRNWAKKQLKAA